MRKHLTYANVVSTLCLFVLLGGTSVAAVALKKNSVKGKFIAANAITTKKVKNRSLLERDFKLGQLPQGERGPQGEPGTAGSAAAYAHINPDGTFDPSRSKGVVGSAKGTDSAFCLTFNVEPRNVVATPHSDIGTGRMAVVRTKLDISPPVAPCTVDGVDYDVVVRVFDHNNGLSAQPFEIVVN